MVTSVPYQLASSEAAAERAERAAAAAVLDPRLGGVRNPMPREHLRRPGDGDPPAEP